MLVNANYARTNKDKLSRRDASHSPDVGYNFLLVRLATSKVVDF